jgi:predicted nuclease of predicted toxin-antitoxin system
MRLYLDDCSDANELVAYLGAAGRYVENPRIGGISGAQDQEHLEYAARQGLSLITRNPDDFIELHQEWQAVGRPHAGILLVYEDNVKGKDMEAADIVRALDKLLASGLPIANELHTLNHWR